jgi:predicted metal-dependent peptidase
MSAPVERSNRVQTLLDHEPKAPQEVIDQAAGLIKSARMIISASNAWIESMVVGVCRFVPTTAIPTMAVTLGGDGLPLFLYNPFYTIQLHDGSPNGVQFVVVHEGGHIVKRHLQTSILGRNLEVWTLATECHLNDWVQRQLAPTVQDSSGRRAARAPMPVIKGEDGTLQKQGIDPKEIFDKYRDDLKKQSKDSVDYDAFIKTDEACYRELMRMAKPPINKNGQSGCSHQPGEGGGSDPHDLPLDEEAVDALMGDILDAAVKAASSDERARKELLDLEGRVEGDKAEKMIGRLGLGALRGEAIVMRETNTWTQYLQQKMASLLEDDERLQVHKRLTAVDQHYDRDPQLTYRGDKPLKTGLLLCDTSGSMDTSALKWFTERAGSEQGLVLDIWAVDTEMYPVKFGEPLKGGGGTDFDSVVDYVRTMDQTYDFVVMYTDGYVNPFHPHEPHKWSVLLTPDGNKSLSEQMPEVEFYELSIEDVKVS